MQILKSKHRLSMIAIPAALFIAALIASLLFVTLPASAQEKKEKRVAEKVKNEFAKVRDAKQQSKEKGLRGEYENYVINDENGNAIGGVAIDSQEEILAITHFKDPDYGDPILSLDDVKNIAKGYLKKWNRELTDEYQVVKEEPSVLNADIDNKQAWVYYLGWSRKAGDITIQADFCNMTIDARSGEVIFCAFPSSAAADVEQAKKIKPQVSKEQAISIAHQNCPSTEDWFNNSAYNLSFDSTKKVKDPKIKIDDKAEQVYLPIDGENHLVWRVTVDYEAHPKGIEPKEDNMLDFKAWMFDIDAVTGDVLSKDQTA